MSRSQEQGLETYAEPLTCEGSWNRILLEPSHVPMEKPQNPVSDRAQHKAASPFSCTPEASQLFLLTPPRVRLPKRGLVSFKSDHLRMCALITFNFK